MTSAYQYAKDYLSQAFHLDQRINVKFDQLKSLRELSTKTTATLSGMPRNPSPAHLDDFIAGSLDLEAEIASDLADMIKLKGEIINVIRGVESPECRSLLELRYLAFKKWEVIAIDMYVNLRYTHKLHAKALGEVDAILRAS